MLLGFKTLWLLVGECACASLWELEGRQAFAVYSLDVPSGPRGTAMIAIVGTS